jgi:hypothetical protein
MMTTPNKCLSKCLHIRLFTTRTHDLNSFWLHSNYRDFRTSSLSMSARLQEDAATKEVNEHELAPKSFLSVAFEFFAAIYYVVIEDFVCGNCADFTAYWGTCMQADPIRQTRSAWYQFYLCMMRAFKQTFNGFGPFVLEMCLHLLCGAVIASAGELVCDMSVASVTMYVCLQLKDSILWVLSPMSCVQSRCCRSRMTALARNRRSMYKWPTSCALVSYLPPWQVPPPLLALSRSVIVWTNVCRTVPLHVSLRVTSG